MNKKTITKLTAVALLTGAAALSLTNSPADAAKKSMEKCYGIAEAGKNDCKNIAGTHACNGQSTVDADPGEWLYIPTGTCDKIVGGLTEEEAKEKATN